MGRDRFAHLLLICLVPSVWVGCGHEEETPFPAGFEPLEENLADPVSEDDPDGLSLVSGTTDDYAWGHARGRVPASILDVWDAVQQADVVVDRRRVDEWTPTYDVEEGYDYSMVLRHVVRDIITVEYDTTWRHMIVDGVDELPTVVAVRWQKTWGNSLIRVLEGSIVLRATAEGATEVEYIEHLGATATGPDYIEGFLVDLHQDVLAWSQGRDLPDLEDVER